MMHSLPLLHRWAMRLLALALILGLGAAPWPGASTAAGREAARVLAQAETVPLGQVLRAIADRFPGRALDAQRTERGGRQVYRIKWLGDDGKVREVLADARSGEILSVR
jgi:uncharacterized iron-regulated membrane protein